MRDQFWYLRAACYGEDPNFWAIQPALYNHPTEANAHAIRVCRHCPVTRECLSEALARGDQGVIRAGIMLHTPQEMATCIGCHKPFLRPKLRNKRPRRHCRRSVCSAAHSEAVAV